jgi:GGDEF domain-containing protein
MRRLLSQLISPNLRRRKKVVGSRVVRLRAEMNAFTAPNDVFGPYTGDTAFRVVLHALEQATRDLDVVSVAQPDGGAFGLTLRVARDADPHAIRDRIESTANEALEDAGLHDAGDTQIGISVGVAELREAHKRRSARTPRRVGTASR